MGPLVSGPARPSGTEVSSRTQSGEIEPYSKHPSETRPYAVCPPPTKTRTSCMSAVVPTPGIGPLRPGSLGLRLGSGAAAPAHDGSGSPAYEGSGIWGGFSPSDLRSAYKLPASGGGAGMTVAITIAYDNPNAELNMGHYRTEYGLAACTAASGCFKKVNQNGEAGNYPPANEEWALETSLDLDMVSAACPECHILLVEANSSSYEDMGAAVDKAAELGANVISDSWAGGEFPEETSEDVHFNHAGIPVLFASGDWGYGVEYPAASPYVIAVGGTALKAAGGSRNWSETAWSGAGSGCSAFEPKPAWQTDAGCSKRTVTDVSAVASPETPVSVYDTYGYSGWVLVGGTSASTPLVAGIEARSSSAFRAAGPSAFWRAGYGTGLFDVTEGENGTCATESNSGFAAAYLCQGETGYDGPTGWGTPNGLLSLPAAITEPPTITGGKATLHGSVDPNGLATEYLFEYGETTAYGSAIPVPNGSAGSGSEYVALSRTLEGLKPETTYHYRITAINTATYHGVDRAFSITPPTATTGKPSEVRSIVATVKGAVNPRGAQTTYYVEYGTTTSYGHKAPAKAGQLTAGTSTVNVSAELPGLSGGTPYHYRLVAQNVAGTTYGADETLVTEPAQWVFADMPQPPNSGLGEEAFDVSCIPSEECIAVGSNWSLDLHASATLAERAQRSSWQPMTTPNPDGLQEGWEHERHATLRGVSCIEVSHPSGPAAECMAVGYYKGTSELIKPIAERWDGTEWVLMEPGVPAGAETAALQDISCVSPTDCTAAGAYVSAANAVEAMVERWDGTKWTPEALSSPAEAKETRLNDISCTSSTQCVAVGLYVTATEAERTLALRWDGTEWIEEVTPNPGERQVARLLSVSCVSSSACVAVGGYQKGPTLVSLAEHWNGSTWTVKSTPTPHEEGGLTGVSCTTSTQCTASGYFYNQSETDHGWRSDMERWTGGSWSLLEIARPTIPSGWWHEEWLAGVSCAEAEACNGVGFHLEAPEGAMASYYAFAEHEVTPPFPAFTSAPSEPLTGESVSFDGSGTVDPGHQVTYEWSFGDGAAGSGAQPSHTYAHAGAYLVSLTVTDDIGRSASVFHFVKVANRPPSASFAVETIEPRGGQPVSFNGAGSSDPDGSIVGYEWDFGDGTTGTGVKPTHAYAHAGEYTVTLTVVDNDGGSNHASHSVNVGNSPPSAFFSVLTNSPVAAQPVSFDASTSTDQDGSLASYTWDFGDGTTGSGVAPSHAYAHAGEYTVTLGTTDNEGLTAQVTHVVSVADAKPVATFSTSAPAIAGQPVSFDAADSQDPDGSIVGYEWDFGDGTTGSGKSAQHAYPHAGVFTASLTVADDGGLTTTVQRVIAVDQPSNQFDLRAIAHSRTTGAVAMEIWLPGAGRLTARSLASALGADRQSVVAIKPVALRAEGPGVVQLRLVPNRSARQALRRRYRLHVGVVVSFAPDFGTPAVRMRQLVLQLGRRSG